MSQPRPSLIGAAPSRARTAGSEIPAAGERYTAVAQALHWATAALMFTALPLAWTGVNIPESMPRHEALLALHKSVGLTILAVVALRLAWRASHPPPPLSAALAPWEKLVSAVSHWLLYVILLGMPLSGYLLSAGAGHPTSYFGLFTLPALAKNDSLQKAAFVIHVVTGQWLVYALILLHLGATVWHVAVRRDGVLERMLPPQDSVLAEREDSTAPSL